jgi:hypothetical protein
MSINARIVRSRTARLERFPSMCARTRDDDRVEGDTSRPRSPLESTGRAFDSTGADDPTWMLAPAGRHAHAKRHATLYQVNLQASSARPRRDVSSSVDRRETRHVREGCVVGNFGLRRRYQWKPSPPPRTFPARSSAPRCRRTGSSPAQSRSCLRASPRSRGSEYPESLSA